MSFLTYIINLSQKETIKEKIIIEKSYGKSIFISILEIIKNTMF